jgi:hypothetical protein
MYRKPPRMSHCSCRHPADADIERDGHQDHVRTAIGTQCGEQTGKQWAIQYVSPIRVPTSLFNRALLTLGNYVKQLFEEIDVRVILQRLGRLAQDEARMTVGLILRVIYGVVNNMIVVMEGGHNPFE